MEVDLLKLKERVEIACEIGESYYREFKTAYEGTPQNKKPRHLKEVCHDIAKTLVAFENADGGELFVGIDDNNIVSGLPYNEEKTDILLHAPKTHVLAESPLSKSVHQTRNTYIGRVLRESGYIRELGEGIRRMYHLMQENHLTPPIIQSPNKTFIVTFFAKPNP